MLGNKTKQDDTYLDLESPLLDDDRERRRCAFEVEDQPEETGEPYWFKILSCVGMVFPIVRANGKCHCSRANIAWSIYPFICLSFWAVALVMYVSFLFRFLSLWTLSSVLQATFLGILPLTLSYTRKSFSDAIAGKEDRAYVNTLAKRGLIVSVVGGSIVGGITIGRFGVSGIGALLIATSIFSTISVVIIRCLFVTHTQSSQQNTLLELVQGANVQSFQTKLLENCVLVEKASAYLQVPLGVCFTLGTMNLGMWSLLLYLGSASDVSSVMFITALALVVLTPLWILTRIDKQYMWTLRNLLCRNTVMPHTEHSRLLLAYDTIAPRASLFDVYITRGRVATLAIAFVGALVPKLVGYLMTL